MNYFVALSNSLLCIPGMVRRIDDERWRVACWHVTSANLDTQPQPARAWQRVYL